MTPLRTHGEYFGPAGRPEEVDAMDFEAEAEAEEKDITARMRDTTGAYVEKRRAEIEQMHGAEKHAAIADLFLTLEKGKSLPTTSTTPTTTSRLGPSPEERALLQLRQIVRGEGPVKWSWTAGLVSDPATNYQQERANQDGNVKQLQTSVYQLEAGIKRAIAPGDTIPHAFWHAAARPPWPVVQSANRKALSLEGWHDLIRRAFGLVDVGVAVLHRPGPDALRIAYVTDWLIDGIDTVVAVILDAATLEATKALGVEPGVMLHFQDVKAEVRESTSVTWWYVGMTLADGKLVELVNVRKRHAQGKGV